MNFTIYLPFAATPTEVRALLAEGLDGNYSPISLPPIREHRVPLYVSAQVEGEVLNRAERFKQEPKVIIEGLVWAVHRARAGTAETAAETLLASGLPPRVIRGMDERARLQQIWMKNVREGLSRKQVVLGEASTGLGKTRMLLQLGAELIAADKGNRPWILVPTLSVLSHFLRETKEVPELPPPGVLMGRQQFVSVVRTGAAIEQALKDGVITHVEGASVIQWLKHGKPQVESTRALSDMVPGGLRYLIDDLHSIAPAFPRSECSLDNARDDEIEPAAKIHRRLQESVGTSRWLICTHAMFSVRWRIQGTPDDDFEAPYTHLLIDEAHDFEDTFASIHGSDLSLFALRTWMRGSRSPSIAAKASTVTELMAKLRAVSSRLSGEELDMLKRDLFGIRQVLVGAKTRPPGIDEFTLKIQKIEKASISRLAVRCSPKRSYPSLVCGPANLRHTLQAVWESCAGAVLASGTLYLQMAGGVTSATYMRLKHSIPDSRCFTFPPVHTSWATQLVEVHLPSREAAEKLVYEGGNGENPKAVEAWRCNVAEMIGRAVSFAVGGTLILCCSKDDARSLPVLLPIESRPRVLSPGDRSVESVRDEFMEKARAGERPIWFGTGPAWTGMDLADSRAPAEKDQVLTDLVITRIPFGLKHGSTHFGRIDWLGWGVVEPAEAAVRVRQGIGRLIRRDGVKDRRLWFLDGRPWARAGEGCWRRFAHLVAPYGNRKYFSL